ncbi:hypothetical protein [Nonomuraea sp. NPDC049400]|uniref:hypothetical protein n=1 Tax=Nonomuraea sp. NPDC049400 TaxID=3364352 RepID=UPI0037B844CE
MNVDDLQLGQQVVRQQQPVEQGQDARVVNEAVHTTGLVEHAVDPLGAVALEGVASCLAKQRDEFGAKTVAFIAAEQVGQDDVAVTFQRSQVGLGSA